MLEPLLYFGGTILATLVVAVLLCHYRVSRRKQVSWGTVLASSLIANVAVFFGMGLYEEGFHLFTREAWSGGKGPPGAMFIVVGVITILCVLPALGVAVYYQRRSKEYETPVV